LELWFGRQALQIKRIILNELSWVLKKLNKPVDILQLVRGYELLCFWCNMVAHLRLFVDLRDENWAVLI